MSGNPARAMSQQVLTIFKTHTGSSQASSESVLHIMHPDLGKTNIGSGFPPATQAYAHKADTQMTQNSTVVMAVVGQQPPNFNCFLRVVQSVQMGA